MCFGARLLRVWFRKLVMGVGKIVELNSDNQGCAEWLEASARFSCFAHKCWPAPKMVNPHERQSKTDAAFLHESIHEEDFVESNHTTR